MSAAGRAATCALLAAALGCGLLPVGPWRNEPQPASDYVPDRHDYSAFQSAWPDLHEPNYLPFMSHRVPRGAGLPDALVFCRWEEADMPLPVYVAAPQIPASLEDEFELTDPAGFVTAVDRALAIWEREMEGLVRFRRVDDPAEARIQIALRGEVAPVDAERQVLGSTRLAHSCVVEGTDPDADRLRVRFAAGPLTIYIADEFGLLSQDQVEWIALHEIGHALGMRAHSPIPADLMYEVMRDRVLVRDGLSAEDSNSFVSLYRLPNGTIYADADAAHEDDDSPPPTGPPMLALAPHVDSRHGFRVKLPYGWMRVETAQGVAAVDGVTWDYSASYQVVVSGQPSLDAYLQRYGAWYAGRGRLMRGQEIVVNGHPALQGVLVRPESDLVEELTLIESGDGRVIVVTAECAAEYYPRYAPWFDAVLASLEIEPAR
ncbi:MAG TPA: matrixin family metalloprotease [Myxococcota bacterium]|nr:matrixin family metalloprotease [Myxococcota bacterium]